jgi:ParB/RepB/Spo0J family partition protein
MATEMVPRIVVTQIPLENLVPSAINRDHSEKSIAELAESIKQQGVLQPLIVRPFKGSTNFEIVCGEARWKAAGRNKLQTVPAIVRNYSDQEAQAAQIIENLQRSNPGPLDEARAYENLRKLLGKAATTEGIAAQVGKDGSYVAQRLKLLSLIEPAKKMLTEGIIGIGHALLIAPLQERQQIECIKWLGFEETINENNWGPKVKSVHTTRALSAFIEREFMLGLATAPFDTADPKLNPKMGSCLACPHNTANATSLFPDLKEAQCTLPACFFEKRDRAFDIKVEALAESTGKKKIYRLSIGYQSDRGASGGVKVDGKLAKESYQSGPRYVKPGDECKTTQTAIVAYIAPDEKIKAKVGDSLLICAAAHCPKHGKQRSRMEGDETRSSNRVPLKGMAFVEHKEGNLAKSLPERLRFAVFKAVVDILLKESPPLATNVTWTERMEQLSIWGFEQIGHDQKRDAVKALGLWPKEKKASEMDFEQTLTKHFSGKPWALSMGVLAMQDIRNPYHPHGEARGRRNAWEKDMEHGVFFLAKSYKVDVGKIYEGLKSEDKAVVGKMTANVKAREAKPAKKAKVSNGTKVGKSGPKGIKAKKAK